MVWRICRAIEESPQPSPAIALPPGLSLGREGARAFAGVAPCPRIFSLVPASLRPLLPSLRKLVPLYDVGKNVHIDVCLFAQNSHPFAVLVSPGLQSNRDEIFTSHDARRHILIQTLL